MQQPTFCGGCHKPKERQSSTDHDFVLSGEVWGLTQQLALRHGDGARRFSHQHRVVQLHPSRRWGDQVSALQAFSDGQRRVKLGDKLQHTNTQSSNKKADICVSSQSQSAA